MSDIFQAEMNPGDARRHGSDHGLDMDLDDLGHARDADFGLDDDQYRDSENEQDPGCRSTTPVTRGHLLNLALGIEEAFDIYFGQSEIIKPEVVEEIDQAPQRHIDSLRSFAKVRQPLTVTLVLSSSSLPSLSQLSLSSQLVQIKRSQLQLTDTLTEPFAPVHVHDSLTSHHHALSSSPVSLNANGRTNISALPMLSGWSRLRSNGSWAAM